MVFNINSAGLCSLASRSQDARPAGHGSTPQGASAGECSLQRPLPCTSYRPAVAQRIQHKNLHFLVKAHLAWHCRPVCQHSSPPVAVLFLLHGFTHSRRRLFAGSWACAPCPDLPAHLQTSVAQNVADSIMGQRLVVASTGVSLDDTNTTATTSLPGNQAVTRAQDIQASLLGAELWPSLPLSLWWLTCSSCVCRPFPIFYHAWP